MEVEHDEAFLPLHALPGDGLGEQPRGGHDGDAREGGGQAHRPVRLGEGQAQQGAAHTVALL